MEKIPKLNIGKDVRLFYDYIIQTTSRDIVPLNVKKTPLVSVFEERIYYINAFT